MVKKVLCLMLFTAMNVVCWGQSKEQWVDSVFQQLSIEEKIGQLFMQEVDLTTVAAQQSFMNDLRAHHLGGLIITGGVAHTVKQNIRQFQAESKTPLLIALDAEWGAGKTLDSAFTFPKPLILSALPDSTFILTTKLLAHQLKDLGVNLNLGPNAWMAKAGAKDTLYYFWGNDVNHISTRLSLYIKTLQTENILTGLGDFPAQWLTQQNKIIASDAQQNIYKSLMSGGAAAILPKSQTVPLSFERKALMQKMKFIPVAVSNLLTNTQVEKAFAYDGLLMSNVPDIKLSKGKIRWGEPELFAFQSGNDILINPKNIGFAVRKIKKLVRKEKVYALQLDKSVQKILSAKYDVLPKNNLTETFVYTAEQEQILTHAIQQASVSLIHNTDNLLPIKILDNKKIASISIGINANNHFNQYLARYTKVDQYTAVLPQDSSAFSKLSQYDIVIAGIFPFAESWLTQALDQLKKIKPDTKVILVFLGNPELIPAAENFSSVLATYDASEALQEITAEQIFGALPVVGHLPIRTPFYEVGSGMTTSKLGRLGYAVPQEVGVDDSTLEKIKDIAYEAIDAGATPGCRVLVARKGKVIYDEAFGWLTYENQIPVTEETIYDLASVTKVAATLQTTAFLHEKGLIDINKKISVYLPELKGSNKEDFTIKDILTHQAGLWPFLPFWAQTMKDSLYLPEFYASTKSAHFPFEVTHNLFAAQAMKDSLWQWIIKSKVREKPARTPYDYRYSDMGFYMLQRLAERLLNQPLEDFLHQNLYEPIGASSLGYLPRLHFDSIRIAPTEKDKLFRKSLLLGYVHDQGAAMHGGIAGHAGLFGTAMDLAKLGQLWLNKGSYAGLDYFKPETVSMFTAKQYANSRRGLGWDKRDFVNEAVSPTSKYASANTFGHTGFTGTCIWVDPDYDLIFIFLSNRVHPDMTNNKLLNMNIRTRMHDVVYEAIFNFKGLPSNLLVNRN
jgi:CubicO group peptidase (beta-lactamase class C family)/beta-glucosidase-like glycosyl hydrolase